MPVLFEILTTTAYFSILIFIGYYLWNLRAKEKELAEKESKMDNAYHHIVDDALAKERKILDDAAIKADQIIKDAQNMSNDSKKALDEALEKMVSEIKKETIYVTRNFTDEYASSLKHISDSSIKDFQDMDNELKIGLQKQLKEFHEIQLATLQKELEAYKQTRYKQTEEAIARVIQKASQEILGRAIPLEEHQRLLTESMERAKKEGMFD